MILELKLLFVVEKDYGNIYKIFGIIQNLVSWIAKYIS